MFPLALAPFNWYGFVFLSAGLFFYILQKQPIKYGAVLGFFYGLGKYGLGVSWIYVSISNFSELPWFFSAFITFGFIALLSLYETSLALLYLWLSKNKSSLIQCFLFAALATLMEALRSWLFTGFPWLLAGHSQLLTPLSKIAPLFGGLGVSFFCYLTACFITNAFMLTQKKITHNYLYSFFVLIPFLLCELLVPSQWLTPLNKPLKVSLLQGNVSHSTKWNNEQLDKTLTTYHQLTEQRLSDDLIVWPETALPMPSLYAINIFSDLRKNALEHHSAIVLGAPGMNNDGTLSNSVFLLGKNVGRYDKQHLVPFGEYMPIAFFHPIYRWFNVPFANLTQGEHKADLFKVNNLTLTPFVCFEIAFNTRAYLNRIGKSNLILTLTDDSWFGHSFAKAQHLQIAQMRSLETGRAQLFASNDGLTAFINNQGKLTHIIPMARQGYLHGKIQGYQGNTPFLILGNAPIIIFLLLLILILSLISHRPRNG